MLRISTTVATLALILVAAAPCAGQGNPISEREGPVIERGPLTLQPIVFERTDETPIPAPDRVDAEEGRLRVPVRHDAPSSDSLTIHFVRFASTSPDPGSPIVYLAGGPGGSGTYSAAGDRFGLFHLLRQAGDVIVLDQRGTFLTRPYGVCPGMWNYPLDEPLEPATLAVVLRPFLQECYEAFADDMDVAAFNTRQSAEDLDDLREALRAERLVLWGISYGTHLGLAYIRQHPDRVERAILAGVEGPDHTYKLPSNLDRIFMRVDSAVRADPEAREVMPDLLGSYRALLGALAREPARVELPGSEGTTREVVVGPADLQRAMYESLGEREDIVEVVRRAAPVLAGDLTSLGEYAADASLGNRALVMSLSMDCASGATAARRDRIAEEAETALFGNIGNLSLEATCAAWPVPDLGDEFRSPLVSDVPALFISGTLDPRTPPSNAEEVAVGFSRGHHLVIEGGSHDDDLFLASPVIWETMLAFLRGETELPATVTLPPLKFDLP